MAYSLDFRQRVFAYKEKHQLTFEQTSGHFDINIATLFRWKKRLEPCATRNRPAIKVNMDALEKDIEDFPDDYQWERAKRLNVTQPGIHYALKRLKISVKKTLKHPKSCEIRRKAFIARMEEYEEQEKQIVYLDESGFAQDMPRQYGYSPIGSRCYGSHDWHSKGRINVIGAIVNMTFVTLGMFSSSINSDVFYAWLTQDLLPKLTTGAVIVMDNATFHKRSDMLKAITEHGCIAEYLPPYSPDLNPIEKKWAQAKSIRRKLRCSINELFSKHLDYRKLC